MIFLFFILHGKEKNVKPQIVKKQRERKWWEKSNLNKRCWLPEKQNPWSLLRSWFSHTQEFAVLSESE